MGKIKNWIANFKERFKDKVFVYRFLSGVIALDIVAFLILAGINPLKLLNPFTFLTAQNRDIRSELKLFFPASVIRSVKSNSTAEEAANEPEAEMTHILQKTSQVSSQGAKPEEVTILNVKLILQELVSGPANLKARRFLPRVYPVKKVWLQGDEVLLHLNSDLFKEMNDAEKQFARKAIEKSILENLSEVKKVTFGT